MHDGGSVNYDAFAAVMQNNIDRGVRAGLAVGETVIPGHPLLPLVGVSIETMRECPWLDRLAASLQLQQGVQRQPQQRRSASGHLQMG